MCPLFEAVHGNMPVYYIFERALLLIAIPLTFRPSPLMSTSHDSLPMTSAAEVPAPLDSPQIESSDINHNPRGWYTSHPVWERDPRWNHWQEEINKFGHRAGDPNYLEKTGIPEMELTIYQTGDDPLWVLPIS